MNVLAFALSLTLLLSPRGQTKYNSASPNNETCREACNGANKFPIKELLATYERESRAPNQEQDESTKKTGIFGLTPDGFAQSLFAFILSIITGIYAFLTWRMLHKVGAQVEIMQKQVSNAGEQLITSMRSVNAMYQQIGHMQKANEQTGRLIEESRISANAAKNSADALVNSERAWIQAKIKAYSPLSKLFPPPHHPWVWLRIFIKNHGRTAARVTRIYARAHLLKRFPVGSGFSNPPILPVEPAYDPPEFDTHIVDNKRDILLLPHQQYPFLVEISPEELARIRDKEDMLYIYGLIDYFDISGKQRQTRFCRLYWIPNDSTDPNEEQFMESNVIPEAYTRSN